MSSSQMSEQDRGVLRWGGLAGILGGVLLILVMVFVGVVIGSDPAGLTGGISRFQDIQVARVVENGVYLLGLILVIPLFVALFWAVKETSLAPALFGCVVGIVGLVSMVVSATPHVAQAALSELYHSTEATLEAQTSLAMMWRVTQGVFEAPLYVGFFVLPIGITLMGVAILGSPRFGKGLGWLSVVLGVVGLVGGILQMVDPAGPAGVGSYFAGIIFAIVLGLKTSRLSKES